MHSNDVVKVEVVDSEVWLTCSTNGFPNDSPCLTLVRLSWGEANAVMEALGAAVSSNQDGLTIEIKNTLDDFDRALRASGDSDRSEIEKPLVPESLQERSARMHGPQYYDCLPEDRVRLMRLNLPLLKLKQQVEFFDLYMSVSYDEVIRALERTDKVIHVGLRTKSDLENGVVTGLRAAYFRIPHQFGKSAGETIDEACATIILWLAEHGNTHPAYEFALKCLHKNEMRANT